VSQGSQWGPESPCSPRQIESDWLLQRETVEMTSGHEMQELEDIDKELVFQEYDNRALLSENKKSRGETSGEQTSSSGGGGGAGGYFSLSFYQQFFDVDTTTVGTRLLKSVIPTPSPFYSDQGEQTPDLYTSPFTFHTNLYSLDTVLSGLSLLLCS